MLAWLRCTLRRHHNPVRHPLGGFRCADCGFAGDTYADMGFGEASGYVNPTRHLYSRQNGGEMTTLTGPRRYE